MNPTNVTNRLFRFGRLIFILLVLSVPSMVYADIGDILSRFQFYGTVQEIYDTNVNLTPNRDKKDDFITNAGVGLRFSTLPRSETTGEYQPPSSTVGKRYGVYLDFLPTYVYYAKGTSDNYVSLSGNMDAWYTWDRKLTFRVRDYLIRSEEPLEQNYSSSALPGQILLGSQKGRPIYFRNVAQPSLEYQFGKEDVISVNYINNVYRNREDNLFEDKTVPKLRPDSLFPIDIHSCAEAILCMSTLSDVFPDAKEYAGNAFLWTMYNMQDKDGHFYYLKTPHRTDRMPYIRWGQAWMMRALTSFLAREQGA
jgi:hypothetical protein